MSSWEEQKARASLGKARQYKERGDVQLAIKELSALTGRSFDGVYLECFDMLLELCLCTDDAAHARDLDLSRATNRVKGGNQNMETDSKTLVDMVFKHFEVMLSQMQGKAKQMRENPTEEDLVLAALSGIPASERAKERFVDPCQRAAETVARGLFQNRGLSLAKKGFHIYINAAVAFTEMCHKAGLKGAVASCCVWVSDALQGLAVKPITIRPGAYRQEVEANRKDFFHSQSCCDAAVETLCHMLTLLANQGNWTPAAWSVMVGLKRIADKLMEKTGAGKLHSDAYLKMADVFLSCRIPTYHAHCLAIAARKPGGSADLPTRAVLAALVCPEVDESHNPFATNYDSHAVHEDVVELFNEPKTARSDLLTTLKIDGTVQRADASAQALLAAFENGLAAPSTDFAALYKTVAALAADPSAPLAAYEAPLRQALLRRQMEVLASTTIRVDMQALAMSGAGVSEEQYLRVVEPAFLQDSSLPIEIDAKTKTVMFRDATRAKILSSFTKLASKVDPRPGVAASQVTRTATGVATSSSSNTVLAGITVEDLLTAQRRTQLVHELQNACVEGSKDRESEKKNQLQKAAEKKVKEIRKAELERREKVQAVKYKKTLAEYRERQRQERCKMVLAKLRIKYPRFKVDNAMAAKSAAAFEDELTSALAAYKRKEAEGDNRDTLRGNLFERALRQVEIPRRKEMEATNAEQHKAERAAARQNYLLQHRKEYERRQEERAVLQRFLPDVQPFLESWGKVAGAEKVSKRDEQQRLLEEEKRRLAGQA